VVGYVDGASKTDEVAAPMIDDPVGAEATGLFGSGWGGVLSGALVSVMVMVTVTVGTTMTVVVTIPPFATLVVAELGVRRTVVIIVVTG